MGTAVRGLHDSGAAARRDHVLARTIVLELGATFLRADAREFTRCVIPAIGLSGLHAGRAKDDDGGGHAPPAKVLFGLLVFELEPEAPRRVAQQEVLVHGGKAVGGGGLLGLVRVGHWVGIPFAILSVALG